MRLFALLACAIAFSASPLWAGTHTGPNSGGGSGSWNDLTDVPAGFSDDTDDTGGSVPTVSAGDPIDGTTACTTLNELYVNSTDESVWRCTNSTTETWERTGIAYIDWRPDPTGTTTAGLREALIQCSTTGNCVIQARPNTEYDLSGYTFTSASNQGRVIANVCSCVDDDDCTNAVSGTCEDIYIKGAPGARVTLGTSGSPWKAGTTDGAVDFKQIFRFENTTRGGISDLYIGVYDSCNSTADSTCPDPDVGGASQNAYAVTVYEDAHDIVIERNTFDIYVTNTGSEAGDDNAFNGWFAIHSGSGTDAQAPTGLRILNNVFQHPAVGIGFANSGIYDREPDQAVIMGNRFDLSNFVGDPRPTKNTHLIFNGHGTTVVGNSFDLGANLSTGSQMIAMQCTIASGGETITNVGAGGTVIGNTFTRIGSNDRAVELIDCNGLTFSGNTFMGGQCSGTTSKTCMEDGECGGVETCEPADSVGILIQTGDLAASIGNSITNNVFAAGPRGDGGWDDDTHYAPIAFYGTPSTDPTGGRGNVIANNVFTLSDTTDDGFSDFTGSDLTTSLSRNAVYGNVVAGTEGYVPFDSDISIRGANVLEFEDSSGGEGYSFASEATAPGNYAFTFNIDPATCTGDGSGGALTVVGAGPYTIECSADDGGGGSGDITAVGPGYASGGAFTDGVVSTGSAMFVWEGTTDDANEFTVNAPSADPGADVAITFPSTTGTVVVTNSTSTVSSAMITNDVVDQNDLASDITFADGDSLNFASITLSTTDEGLILTKPADCDAITGVTSGTVCYDTTDDAICVYDGSAMDCQILGAAGTGDVTIVGDCTTGDCFEGTGAENELKSVDDMIIHLDDDNNGTESFQILDGANATAFEVAESGNVTLASGATITIPATATDGQYMAIYEDTDNGTSSWSLDVGTTNLAADSVVSVRTDGGLDFSASTGTLVAAGFYSDAADPADGGEVRLGNAETVCWEASPAGTDVCITATSGEIIDITGGTLQGADLAADSVTMGTQTTGNYVSSATGSGGLVLTGTEGGSLGIDLLAAGESTSGISSASGLINTAAGHGLLQGCSNGEILKWVSATTTWDCGADATGGTTPWDSIGDATGVGSINFSGNDQDIVSGEDGGDILTITNADTDQSADSINLRLATNDTTGDANTIYLRATADEDGTPTTEFNLAGTANSGGLTMTLGSTGVVMTTDGDGALTFLGQSAGADEDLTFNFDDTANEVTVTSSTGVTTVNFPDASIPGADIKTGEVTATQLGTDSVASDEIAANAVGSSEMADDAIDEAELAATFTACNTLYKSTGSIADTEDVTTVWRAPEAVTITEVWCETNTGTVTMDVQIDDGTPADVMGVDLVCDSTAESDSTGLTGSMAAGDRLDWAITSVASSPARLTVCIEYTY